MPFIIFALIEKWNNDLCSFITDFFFDIGEHLLFIFQLLIFLSKHTFPLHIIYVPFDNIRPSAIALLLMASKDQGNQLELSISTIVGISIWVYLSRLLLLPSDIFQVQNALP